jgi:ABC-2 type transport system permease protein
LLLPLVAAAAAGAAFGGRWSADLALRLAAWSAGMSAYLAVLALLGVGVCLRLRSTRLALVGLLAAWLVFTLLLPRVAGSQVEASLPLRSTQAIKQQLQDEAPSFWSAETAQRYEREILARAGAASREDFALNYRGAELDYAERASHAVYDRVLGEFYASVTAQDAAYASWGWLSPSVAAQTLSATLAGTDFGHQLDFIAAAERYRRDLVNRMNTAVMQHAPDAGGKAYTADRAFWATQPAFVYAAPPLRTQAQRLSGPLLALAAWLIAALAGVYCCARGARV